MNFLVVLLDKRQDMKRKFINYFSILIAFFFFAGCKKISFHDQPVSLHDCSDKEINAYICFDSLIEDSRCPIGAECIWSGTAVVQVTFHEKNKAHTFRMSQQGFPRVGYPHDTTIAGYKIVFSDLKPYLDLNNLPAEATTREAYFDISPE